MAARINKIFDAALFYSPSSVPARNTGLLLLDYQVFIVSRLGEPGAQTVRRARELLDWAQTNKVAVFHCVVDAKDKPKPVSRIAERWAAYEAMIEQQPDLGGEVSELEDSDEHKVFTRRPGLVSALSSPGILDALRDKEIRSLILCGLSTSGCVLSTVRAATDQDLIVTVVEDACYDPVPGLHDMLVKHVLPTTAHVVTSEEVRSIWSDS